MLNRLEFRVQPIEHIRKRKQRHKEMEQRKESFERFLMAEKKKLMREHKESEQV